MDISVFTFFIILLILVLCSTIGVIGYISILYYDSPKIDPIVYVRSDVYNAYIKRIDKINQHLKQPLLKDNEKKDIHTLLGLINHLYKPHMTSEDLFMAYKDVAQKMNLSIDNIQEVSDYSGWVSEGKTQDEILVYLNSGMLGNN